MSDSNLLRWIYPDNFNLKLVICNSNSNLMQFKFNFLKIVSGHPETKARDVLAVAHS